MPGKRKSRPAAGASSQCRRWKRRLALEPLEDRRLLALLEVGAGLPFATVQSAVDAARPGDVVLLSAGQYDESIDLSRMGSAVGGSPGDLTVRGESRDQVVIAPPGHAAFFSDVALAGDFRLDQLTVTGVSAEAGTRGVTLQELAGELRVTDVVFQQLPADGLNVAALAGELAIGSSQFDRVGDGSLAAAIRIAGLQGYGSIRDNVFSDVSGTAIHLENGADRESSWLLSNNQIHGDGSFFATTGTAIRMVLDGDGRTDFVADDNDLANLAGTAIDVEVGDQAELQMRWSRNVSSNSRGESVAAVWLHDQAQASFAAQFNSWTDSHGDGLTVQVDDAAELRAVIRDEAFISLGDGVGDEALVIASGPNATGKVDVLLHNNTFATVAGNGMHVSADGQAAFRAVMSENFFSETNTLVAGSGILVEQAGEASAASMDLRLDSNNVFDNASQAYALHQRGSGAMRLEGSTATAQAQIEATNVGSPVVVTGTVQMLAPGTLDAAVPLLLGDRLWLDADGDGVQGTGEAGVGGITIRLTGVETASGAAIDRTTHSDSSGKYLFPGLAAGEYTLTVEVPFAMRLAPMNQGTDDALDSDFDSDTGQASVVLTPSADDLSLDGGLWRTWQNPANPLDVDGDGAVIPLDVLRLINDINANGIRALSIPPVPPDEPPPYLDVNGDGDISPQDVLIVINFLNARAAEESGEGEAFGPLAWPLGEADSASVPEVLLRPTRGRSEIAARRKTEAKHQTQQPKAISTRSAAEDWPLRTLRELS